MQTSSTAHYSRPLKTGLCLGLPMALIVLLLAFPPNTLDLAISHLFYSAELGFTGKHSFLLETILHERAKQSVITLMVFALLGLIASFFYKPWTWLRLPLGYIVLSVSICTAVVTPLKVVTGVQCPWNLAEFGGKETYSPLLSTREPTTHPGKCWPAGHPSSGFVFFAVYFLLRDHRPRLAKAALAFALTLGSVLSMGRIMQGAHFLSHTLWTALFDWLIALGCYHFLLYRPKQTNPAFATQEPSKSITSLD